jgi:organic radical activating enzyme
MDSKTRKIRYSEIFSSFQGEGQYTGVPTLWLRIWGCNFECKGFGQKNVDDPSTWELPYMDFDIKKIQKMEDLPVWHTGCDSSYSWSKKFIKLAQFETADEIAEKLISLNVNEFNPKGKFMHERSGQETHMAFTGGEPMMNQQGIVDVMEAMHARDKNSPIRVTVETNGTQEVKEYFKEFMQERFYRYEEVGGMMSMERTNSEWFWSVSPKLRASGEKWSDAILPEVVAGYNDVSPHGQLKFVVDGDERTWFEVEQAVKLYREAGIDWPVWIMPVGADLEMQDQVAAKISRDAIARGYNVAVRAHVYVFGNTLGT